jgi:hypothetical protein
VKALPACWRLRSYSRELRRELPTEEPESTDNELAESGAGDSRGPFDLDNEIEKLRANVPVEDVFFSETTVPRRDKAETSMDVPACPEDPSPQNPAPLGHPAHRIWEDATHAAELDLARFKHRLEDMRSEVLQSIETMMPRFQKELLHGNSETYESFKVGCDQFWERWHILYLVGIFHIWAERPLCLVLNHETARYHENWLTSYSRTILETGKRLALADERLDPHLFVAKLQYQLSRECIYANLRARETVAAIHRGAADQIQPKSGDGLAQSQRKPTKSGMDPNLQDSVPDDQVVDKDPQPVSAGPYSGTEKSVQEEKSAWTDKEIETAVKMVAEKQTVTTKRAAQFLNCSVQHIRRLVHQEKLIASGTRPMQITSASLRDYKWPKRVSIEAPDRT